MNVNFQRAPGFQKAGTGDRTAGAVSSGTSVPTPGSTSVSRRLNDLKADPGCRFESSSIRIDGRSCDVADVWEEIEDALAARGLSTQELGHVRALLGRHRDARTYEDLAEALVAELNRVRDTHHPVRYTPAPVPSSSGFAKVLVGILSLLAFCPGGRAAPVPSSREGRVAVSQNGLYANVLQPLDREVFNIAQYADPLTLDSTFFPRPGGERIAPGTYLYVVRDDGSLVMADATQTDPAVGRALVHPDLAGGHDVRAAGVVHVAANGQRTADLASVHYFGPDLYNVNGDCELTFFDPLAQRAATRAFARIGQPVAISREFVGPADLREQRAAEQRACEEQRRNRNPEL